MDTPFFVRRRKWGVCHVVKEFHEVMLGTFALWSYFLPDNLYGSMKTLRAQFLDELAASVYPMFFLSTKAIRSWQNLGASDPPGY